MCWYHTISGCKCGESTPETCKDPGRGPVVVSGDGKLTLHWISQNLDHMYLGVGGHSGN